MYTARQHARQNGLPSETKHMVNGNDVIRPWIIFRGGQICVERSKNLECDRIMKAFFVERNKQNVKYIHDSGAKPTFLRWGFQITKRCLVSDKYRSEVALKIDTVKDGGVRGRVPEALEPPSWLCPLWFFLFTKRLQNSLFLRLEIENPSAFIK